MINCELVRQLAFLNCFAVEPIHGGAGVCVQTYHLWIDNTPLSFYIQEVGRNRYLITDDGDTLFHFQKNGLLEDKRSWRSIQEKLDCTQSAITFVDGEINCLCAADELATQLANYTSALCALMHYEREIINVPEAVLQFSQEVEYYLRAWKPNAHFAHSPKVQGISGHTYTFDFQVDNDLYLAISPTPAAVGGAMRKIGDVLSGSFLDGRQLIVIVDDRSDDLFKAKAEEEIQIISVLAKAVPFTTLQSLVSTTQAALN